MVPQSTQTLKKTKIKKSSLVFTKKVHGNAFGKNTGREQNYYRRCSLFVLVWEAGKEHAR